MGFSYADLAVKYEMSKEAARKTYHNEIKRLLEILKTMDSEKPVDISRYRKQIEARSGKIPKGQK
jgi:hypothetical protein